MTLSPCCSRSSHGQSLVSKIQSSSVDFEFGGQFADGGNLEVVFRCGDFERAVRVLRGGDGRGLVAGGNGDRSLLLLLDLVALAVQDELVGDVVFLDGQPAGVDGVVFPRRVGLDVHDDLSAQALEADRGVAFVFSGEPCVFRRDAQFGRNAGRFVARDGVGVGDRLFGAPHHAEQ